MIYAKAFIAPLLTLVVVVGVFFGGLSIGQSIERGKQAQDHAELLTSAYNQYQATINHQRESAEKAIRGLEIELEQIRSERTRMSGLGRLRIPAAACNGLPNYSDSTGAGQAAAGTVELPEAIDTSLRAIASDADEVTARCRALLTWAKDLEKQ